MTIRFLLIVMFTLTLSACEAVEELAPEGLMNDEGPSVFERLIDSLAGRCGQNLARSELPRPVEGAVVTSTVNAYRIINGQARPHYGTDFGAPTGTPIIAIADGVIEERRLKGSFGNYIQVEHGHGYDTRYAHMSRFEAGLAVGDCVSQGDVIGYVGSTGRSTGPHLHIEIRKNDKALFPRELGLSWAKGSRGP